MPFRPACCYPSEEKSPKKKPLTITEKATAKYAPEDPTPLHPYFSTSHFKNQLLVAIVKGLIKTALLKSTFRQGLLGGDRPLNLRLQNESRRKGQLPILLSPESALKKVKDQDVLFGTSSQLVGDESPTFLRDLQQAMKVSEAMPDQDSFVDSGYGDETPRPDRPRA
jgi:hypothetical protein